LHQEHQISYALQHPTARHLIKLQLMAAIHICRPTFEYALRAKQATLEQTQQSSCMLAQQL
jgi:hypothetical protein